MYIHFDIIWGNISSDKQNIHWNKDLFTYIYFAVYIQGYVKHIMSTHIIVDPTTLSAYTCIYICIYSIHVYVYVPWVYVYVPNM